MPRVRLFLLDDFQAPSGAPEPLPGRLPGVLRLSCVSLGGFRFRWDDLRTSSGDPAFLLGGLRRHRVPFQTASGFPYCVRVSSEVLYIQLGSFTMPLSRWFLLFCHYHLARSLFARSLARSLVIICYCVLVKYSKYLLCFCPPPRLLVSAPNANTQFFRFSLFTLSMPLPISPVRTACSQELLCSSPGSLRPSFSFSGCGPSPYCGPSFCGPGR